jgi:hypothetical protein
MKARIAHAIQMVSNWNSILAPGNPGTKLDTQSTKEDKVNREDPNPPFVPPHLTLTSTTQDPQHDTRNGWLPAHPQLPQEHQHDTRNGWLPADAQLPKEHQHDTRNGWLPPDAQLPKEHQHDIRDRWKSPNPQLQHPTTGNTWIDPPPPQRIHHRSRSHEPTPDPEDWEIVPHAKLRQRNGTPHPNTRLQPQSQPNVEHFDRSISTMLYTDQGPMTPAGVFARKNEQPEASSRRKRDKKRSSNRKRDRLSKWFRRGYDSADGGSESDDPDDRHGRSQHLHPLDLNRHLAAQQPQQQRHGLSPRPTAWQIYAPPAPTQPQSFGPPYNDLYSHQQPPHDSAHVPDAVKRHRPPPLDLSDAESLSKSMGLLNFRQ